MGRVVVVTGGGGGIGAAIAQELGRRGAHVVTLDPMVSLDGSERLPAPEETTAGRIVAAGGSAQASSASVTDADAVEALFDEVVAEHGAVDAVVNVAGISRPTGFARGTDEDWRAVLTVHLEGYRTILAAALPRMAAAGHGRILGVTSGSGWRAADAGAYGCAKRAVAALTWQLGRQAPPGVTVNAISPIARTRMVTAALGRAPATGGGATAATGGLSLGSMPQPEDLGPLAAHLVAEGAGWCTGQVLFAGGSEVALVAPPQLLEVVQTEGVASPGHLLDAVGPRALVPAEADQRTHGGGNPRFGAAFEPASGPLAAGGATTCAVVSDRPPLVAALSDTLAARGVAVAVLDPAAAARGFAGPVDAVVVALAGRTPGPTGAEPWARTLAEHVGLVDGIHADATWARAAADHAAAAGRALRLVTVTDATTAGGRSRAQAAAQLARAAARATEGRVAAFAVGDEGGGGQVAELVAHLVGHPDAAGLAGAELVAAAGWVGLRSHPRPAGSIDLAGPALPSWFDAALRELVGAPGEAGP